MSANAYPTIPGSKSPLVIKTGRNVPDLFTAEVHEENRRLTGVTPKLLHSWPQPARQLPKSKGFLKSLAGAKKVSGGVKF